MKIVRFLGKDNNPHWGILDNEFIFCLTGDIFGNFSKGERLGRIETFTLLAPAEPSIGVASVLNYRDRLKEEGRLAFREHSLFYKPPNTVIGPDTEVEFPRDSRGNTCEAELCIVIKKLAKNIPETDALGYVLGYTCGIDFGSNDYYRKDKNLARVKGFDSSGPLGPYLETELDTTNLWVRCRVNGILKQDGNTSNMVFNVAKLISHITAYMTLSPGDVIWTGSPKGGAIPVFPGDCIEVEIQGLGILKNEIRAATQKIITTTSSNFIKEKPRIC